MPVELPVRPTPEHKALVPTAGANGNSIVDSIPLKLVLWLASPYLAGQTAADAVRVAHRIYSEHHFASTVDILGEDCDREEHCELAVKNYQDLIDIISAQRLPCSPQEQMTVSLKPSMFSTAAPGAGAKRQTTLDAAQERIRRVVDHAFRKQINVTIEAEDYRWTDFHLDTYLSLVNAGYSNAGTVLQSRLFRTANDVKRFDHRMRVRLVIGIYNECSDIALTDKTAMKSKLVEYALHLAGRGTYLELATHDTACLDQFMRKVAIPHRLPSSAFETQWLKGVPRLKVQRALVNGTYFENWHQDLSAADSRYLKELGGVVVRLYLPFGKDVTASAYCKRRLKANPNMIAYGIKNLLHLQ